MGSVRSEVNLNVQIKPVKILVADDDLDDQYLIKQAFTLTSMYTEIVAVYDGAQLLKFLDGCNKPNANPDIIVLDLNMPIMDGLTALSRLKRITNCSNIPVYVLSTSKHESDKKTCELMGAKQFFTKPTSFGQLQSVARQILWQEFPVGGKAS